MKTITNESNQLILVPHRVCESREECIYLFDNGALFHRLFHEFEKHSTYTIKQHEKDGVFKYDSAVLLWSLTEEPIHLMIGE